MKNKHEILAILSRVKPELEKQYNLRKMALFGSFARNEQNSSSDIDLLVDVPPTIGLEFVTLADTLEEILKIPVDLVSIRAISKKKLKRIEEDLVYV